MGRIWMPRPTSSADISDQFLYLLGMEVQSHVERAPPAAQGAAEGLFHRISSIRIVAPEDRPT